MYLYHVPREARTDCGHPKEVREDIGADKEEFDYAYQFVNPYGRACLALTPSPSTPHVKPISLCRPRLPSRPRLAASR
jgi:hypothetical protein